MLCTNLTLYRTCLKRLNILAFLSSVLLRVEELEETRRSRRPESSRQEQEAMAIGELAAWLGLIQAVRKQSAGLY